MNREIKKSMKEVRNEIDQIDKDRIEEVIVNIKEHSSLSGLSTEISEPLWRKLIELSIEHEFKEFEKKKN